ncbi:WD40 repeat-like protein [Dacryopinax primogenitus]|uniref:WD40 repeat-like protein n=1 Tax=Dacryopinax primogenitus (strain DJM 731) TaxID=1858805 RepID=M5G9H1_DACPD|nr:WD40 repeat-like protein [Dacryopinax primogenitus]EJU05444.1 WD40 repeat-like protein [Dacryopinax primogenitus]
MVLEEWLKADSNSPISLKPMTGIESVIHVHLDLERNGNSSAPASTDDSDLVQAVTISAQAMQTSSAVTHVAALVNNGQKVEGAVASAETTCSTLLGKLDWFVQVMDIVTEVVKAQKDRDDNIMSLVEIMNDTYAFIQEASELKEMMKNPGKDTLRERALIRLAKQTVECANFISTYSKDKGFLSRLSNQLASGAHGVIKQYKDSFVAFKQDFREGSQLRTEFTAFCMAMKLDMMAASVDAIGAKLDIRDIPYVNEAGYDSDKVCLSGTRTAILEQITEWANSNTAETAEIFVLLGPAGTGKSTIAHTIAGQLNKNGQLGSMFCFNRNEATMRRPASLFRNIAHDLCKGCPAFKAALSESVRDDRSMCGTNNINLQFEMFLIKPAGMLDVSGMIGIIIDAVDESGTESERKQMLQVIAQRAKELPAYFRFVLVSRDLPDINRILLPSDNIHVERVLTAESDDYVSDDIFAYTCHLLTADQPASAPGIGLQQEDFRALAIKSGGVFQMVLTTFKPLCTGSISSLMSVTCPEDEVDWTDILRSLGSLLSGVNGDGEAVRPLHISFSEFLQDRERGEKFFIGGSGHHEQLAVACLGLLKTRLHFNMGKIDTSYLPNTKIWPSGGYEGKVPEELEYACAYWCQHLSQSEEGFERGSDITSLLRHLFTENFLFWVDAASVSHVTRELGPGLAAAMNQLPLIGRPQTNCTKEAQQFLRRFGRLISESAAHIYVSALTWTPSMSKLGEFNGTIWVYNTATGLQEGDLLIGHRAAITWLDSSHDGARVLSGSKDATLRVWDVQTGNTMNDIPVEPTAYITSPAISPDVDHIMYTSAECMVKLGNEETGELLWERLAGRISMVDSVTFSHNAAHLISYSGSTVVAWNAKTGEAIGRKEWGYLEQITSLAISDDGLQAVAGFEGTGIKIWNLRIAGRSEEEIGLDVNKEWTGLEETVTSVAFTQDEKRIISASDNGTIRIWDAASGDIIGELLAGHPGAASAIDLWHDGGRTLVASTMRTITLWNTEMREVITKIVSDHAGILCLALSRDAMRIAAVYRDGTVGIWDVTSGERIYRSWPEDENMTNWIVLSHDGSRMVSESYHGPLKLWNVTNGKVIGQLFGGHTDYVTKIAFSDDNSRMVSGSKDGTIRLWDGGTGFLIGDPLTAAQNTRSILSLAFSPNATRIISRYEDCSIRIWDTNTGLMVGDPLIGHAKAVSCLAFSHDGSRIVSGSGDCTVRIWDANTGKAIRNPLTGHANGVRSVTFSQDDTRIVSCASDGTIRAWLAENGERSGTVVSVPGEVWTDIPMTGSGIPVLATCSASSLQMWDVEKGEDIGRAFTGHPHRVISARFSKDGKQVLSVSEDNSMKIWNVDSGEEIGEPSIGPPDVPIGVVGLWHDSGSTVIATSATHVKVWDTVIGKATSAPIPPFKQEATCLILSRDGTRIAAGCKDGMIMVWDVNTGKAICPPLIGHQEEIQFLRFSHNNLRIVSRSYDKLILWNADTGESIGEGEGRKEFSLQPSVVAFSGDSKHIAFALGEEIIGNPLVGHTDDVTELAFSHDSTCFASALIRVWNAEPNDEPAKTLNDDMSGVTCVAFSAHNKRIVSGHEDDTIRLWDAATGQIIRSPLTGHTRVVTSVVFSCDGKFIVSGSEDSTVRIWDGATGEAMGKPLTGNNAPVTCLAISLDSKRIASGSWDDTIRMWDVEKREPIGEPLKGHTNWVTSVAFSSDGKFIVSGSDDRTIRLWSVEMSHAIGGPLTGNTSYVTSVTFSPNGKRIVSVSWADALRIWDVDSGRTVGMLLTGHTSFVNSVAYSPDGTHIVSGSDDKTVRLWDAEACQPIGKPLTGHMALVKFVAFSSDGKRIVSGSMDGTVRVWSAETGTVVGQQAPINEAIGLPTCSTTTAASSYYITCTSGSLASNHNCDIPQTIGDVLSPIPSAAGTSTEDVVDTTYSTTRETHVSGDAMTPSEPMVLGGADGHHRNGEQLRGEKQERGNEGRDGDGDRDEDGDGDEANGGNAPMRPKTYHKLVAEVVLAPATSMPHFCRKALGTRGCPSSRPRSTTMPPFFTEYPYFPGLAKRIITKSTLFEVNAQCQRVPFNPNDKFLYGQSPQQRKHAAYLARTQEEQLAYQRKQTKKLQKQRQEKKSKSLQRLETWKKKQALAQVVEALTY